MKYPIDLNDALKGNDPDELCMNIGCLYDIGVAKNMKALANAVEQRDYKGMKSSAHKIKGNSSIVSASRLYYAALYV